MLRRAARLAASTASRASPRVLRTCCLALAGAVGVAQSTVHTEGVSIPGVPSPPNVKEFGAFSLEGKTAIVTGGASGIGYAISEIFASKGATVCIIDLNVESIEKAQKEICAKVPTAKVYGYKCDISDIDQVTMVFDKVALAHQRLDILVNNAGIAHVGSVVTTKPQDFDRLYAVNVKGAYHCLQAGVKHMKADGRGGNIVNLASIASLFGVKDRFAYGMTKGAMLTMTYSVATDFMHDNIRCNCVCPTRVHTPFVDGFVKKNYPGKEQEMYQKLSAYNPLGRMATPNEIAGLVLYLAADESAMVTGAAYPVDGGVLNCIDARASA